MSLYPDARFSYSLTYDETNQEIILFGGFAPRMKFDDTWSWNRQGWCFLTNYGPSARDSAAITYDSRRECIFLFGGHTIDDRFENDTWRWKDHKWVHLVVAAPPARNHSTMVYFPPTDKTILFGGRSKQKDLGDTWAWDGSQWQQLDIPGPSPRDGYRMVYDSSGKKILLFGGRARVNGSTVQLGDTWEFNGNGWKQVCNSGPMPRSHPAMVYHPVSKKILLFGGLNNNTPFCNDFWEWDGHAWTQLSLISPAPRARIFMTSTANGTALSFGGDSPDGPLDDTWLWDGRCFQEITYELNRENATANIKQLGPLTPSQIH